MIPVFNNWTARSRDDLFRDLTACRQLRHVTEEQKQQVCSEFFDGLKNTQKTFVWEEEAFELVFSRHGYSCDICDTITTINPEKLRYGANRALSNLDCYTKLMLCAKCSRLCERFCKRVFDRELRAVYTPNLEKMMIAFIAFKTSAAAKGYLRGQDGKCSATGTHRENRTVSG